MTARPAWTRATTALAAVALAGMALGGCSTSDEPGNPNTTLATEPPATGGTAGSTTTSATSPSTATSGGTATSSPVGTGSATPIVAKTAQLGGDGFPVDMPAAARAHTVAGQEAFARYFIDSVNRAVMGPEVGLIASISDDLCQGCAVYESTAREYASNGTRYTSPVMRVDSAGPLAPDADGNAVVAIAVTGLAANRVDSSGRVVNQSLSDKNTSRLQLRWTGSGYKVMGTYSAP